jgi:MFS transporter, MHS family, citrate/tricarballylate:H+ symporter
MILSFAMMGFAIITLALTPSYDAIGVAAPVLAVVARLVQGFSLGGEVGPTTAYLMEAATPGTEESPFLGSPRANKLPRQLER